MLHAKIHTMNKKEKAQMIEKTCAIIKPHAVQEGLSGQIISIIELNGFAIEQMKKIKFAEKDAQDFYAVHKERPFFGELVDNMIAGPVIVMALAKKNAIHEWRELMGATDPEKALVGTLRKMFGKSISYNATHGSDSPETARRELKQLFNI